MTVAELVQWLEERDLQLIRWRENDTADEFRVFSEALPPDEVHQVFTDLLHFLATQQPMRVESNAAEEINAMPIPRRLGGGAAVRPGQFPDSGEVDNA